MKKPLRSLTLSFTILLSSVSGVFANNVRITQQPEMVDRNDVSVKIRFGVSWDNSWKSNRPNNHDAIWVYAKYWDGNEWRHVYLNNDSSTHLVPMDGKVEFGNLPKTSQKGVNIECGYSMVQLIGTDVSEERVKRSVGVFISRKDNGRGNISLPNVYLDWVYSEQDLQPDDELAVKVFVVEMVYVPSGEFYLGGTGTERDQFTTAGAVGGTPMLVSSEAPIVIANSADPKTLYTTSQYRLQAGTIPADFPKGYKAFYIMKYELTQEAWADFLNTLDFARQDGHTQAALNGIGVGQSPWNNAANALIWYRNGIVCTQIGDKYQFGCNLNANAVYNEKTGSGENEVNADGQDVAMNFVSWADLLAYLDFAGLRPMTEMEYEKACRGPLVPVPNEYAWGNVFLKLVNYTWNAYNSNTANRTTYMSGHNTGNERFNTIFNATGIYGMYVSNNACGTGSWWWNQHYCYAYPSPARVGCFADSTTNRQASGATYWGAMNMSDNVAEMCVNAVHSTGYEGFKGTHGDGMLEPDGSASAYHSWPTDSNSFIARGMRQWGNGFLTYSPGCVATDLQGHWNNASNGYSKIEQESGRVSDRYCGQWAIQKTNRNPMSSNWFMPGIRGVRTQGAQK